MAFIFADLIVLPIIAIYRKYYGTGFALRITAPDVRHDGRRRADHRWAVQRRSGSSPTARGRPATTSSCSIEVDYKLLLNVVASAVFAGLFWLTWRRGATDPVCGMKVDRSKAITKTIAGETYYFCSEHCLHAFEANPQR